MTYLTAVDLMYLGSSIAIGLTPGSGFAEGATGYSCAYGREGPVCEQMPDWMRGISVATDVPLLKLLDVPATLAASVFFTFRKALRSDLVGVLEARRLRLHELSWDPAQRILNPHEGLAAIRFEERYGVRLRRDPSGDYDFFHGSTPYDVKGADPALTQFYRHEGFTSSIMREITTTPGVTVIVDFTYIPPQEWRRLEAFLSGLPSEQIRVLKP